MSPAVSLPTLEQIFTVSLQFSTNSPYRPIPGVCVCACVCIYMCVCMCVCVCVRICVCMCVYICMCVCLHGMSHDVTISSVTLSFLDVHVPYLISKKSDDAGEHLIVYSYTYS